MPLSQATQTIFAFKNLLLKSNTDVNKALNNEAEGIFLNLPGDSIWIDTIDSTPATAVSNGKAVSITANMVLDGTSNGHALFAVWPSSPPTGTDPKTGSPFAYGTGSLLNINPGTRVRNAIPPAFGIGYLATPYDGANQIPVGDQRDWVYQYNSGIFFQEDGINESWGGSAFGHPTTIELYVYIGDTASDISGGGGGNNEWYPSVKSIECNPPVSPSVGDRYLICPGPSPSATGAWLGKEDQIAEWAGISWTFTSPTQGGTVQVDSEIGDIYLYTSADWPGGTWIKIPSSVVRVGVANGTDSYSATVDPLITSYDSLVFICVFQNANTGASTLNVNSIGIKPIKKSSNGSLIDLLANDIRTGVMYMLVYDGTVFQLYTGDLGDFIPLSGTNTGSPIYGDLEVDNGTKIYTDGGATNPALSFQSNHLLVEDGLIKYDIDRSISYDNRSLVDKEYVDDSITAIPDLWDITGSDIQTGPDIGSPNMPNVLPRFNDAQDLGSDSKRWKDLYLGSVINFASDLDFISGGGSPLDQILKMSSTGLTLYGNKSIFSENPGTKIYVGDVSFRIDNDNGGSTKSFVDGGGSQFTIGYATKTVIANASDIRMKSINGGGDSAEVVVDSSTDTIQNIITIGSTVAIENLDINAVSWTQTGLLSSGSITLNFAVQDPSIQLKSDTASGGFRHEIQSVTPTADRLAMLQNASGTIAYTSDILNIFNSNGSIPAATTRTLSVADDSVLTFSAPTFGTILSLDGATGKVTIPGLLDPIGLQMTIVAFNPGNANTLWSNSGDSSRPYWGAANKFAFISDIPGAESLATTLVAGFTTGANPIEISSGQSIQSHANGFGNRTRIGFNPLSNIGDKSITLEGADSYWSIKDAQGGLRISSTDIILSHNSDAALVKHVSASGFTATYDASGITADRTATLQNASGTIAYTSDCLYPGGVLSALKVVDNVSHALQINNAKIALARATDNSRLAIQGDGTNSILTAYNSGAVKRLDLNLVGHLQVGDLSAVDTNVAFFLQKKATENILRVRSDNFTSHIVVNSAGTVLLGSGSATGSSSYDLTVQGNMVISDGANGNAGSLTLGGGGTPNASTLIRVLIPDLAASKFSTANYVQHNNSFNSCVGYWAEMKNAAAISYGFRSSGVNMSTMNNFYAATGGTIAAAEYGFRSVLTSAATNVYGGHFLATGTGTNNYAGWFQASGATNNYALVTNGGDAGFNTTTPQGIVDINGDFGHRLSTPGSFAVNQDDFPTTDTSFVRLANTAGGPVDISGFANGFNGKRLVIANVGSVQIVLKNDDVNSAAANRMLLYSSGGGGGADYPLNPDDVVELIYDSVTARWRKIN